MKCSLVLSEQGMFSLASAGVTTGWLRAWLMAAGAASVHVEWLHHDDWRHDLADWQLFVGQSDELEYIHRILSQDHVISSFKLDNPDRQGCCFRRGEHTAVLIPVGDVVFQRHHYLTCFNRGDVMRPLYVCSGEAQRLPLEAGLSASLEPPADASVLLNDTGLMIEEQVIALLRRRGLGLRSVESCTAGALVARLCRVPGASAVIDRSWVTYSNQAKHELVAVPEACIASHGAVSKAVVCAMAEGAIAEGVVSVAVSGVAGPAGGTPDKPVGTVWIAVAQPGQPTISRRLQLSGSRHDIQACSVVAVLQLLIAQLEAGAM
ncbi:CinA family protein [Mariprofundus erugo]|uniref:CinA family protein n=1 Tax=Mariprofundus erugo TaxID=2528639 RepID=UPI0010FF29B2|nr:CinA family protein [Mariprofundus erugo]TLS74877.1 CinA family protein [Mariprofundus erugo]